MCNWVYANRNCRRLNLSQARSNTNDGIDTDDDDEMLSVQTHKHKTTATMAMTEQRNKYRKQRNKLTMNRRPILASTAQKRTRSSTARKCWREKITKLYKHIFRSSTKTKSSFILSHFLLSQQNKKFPFNLAVNCWQSVQFQSKMKKLMIANFGLRRRNGKLTPIIFAISQ